MTITTTSRLEAGVSRATSTPHSTTRSSSTNTNHGTTVRSSSIQPQQSLRQHTVTCFEPTKFLYNFLAKHKVATEEGDKRMSVNKNDMGCGMWDVGTNNWIINDVRRQLTGTEIPPTVF